MAVRSRAALVSDFDDTVVRDATAAASSLVLLSGGIDSAACMHFCLDQHANASAVFVSYGQPAEEAERRASRRVAEYYGVDWFEINVKLSSPIPLPGLVPNRNLSLVALALLGMKENPASVVIGMHAGTDYLDCSPEFVHGVQAVLDHTSGGTLVVEAPFLQWTKEDIVVYAQAHNVPLHLTWSCESDRKDPCGRCLSCLDREASSV